MEVGRPGKGVKNEAEAVTGVLKVDSWGTARDNSEAMGATGGQEFGKQALCNIYRGKNGRVGGSGLGLTIVQSVVQAHDGRVSVESEAGAGSRFVVELWKG